MESKELFYVDATVSIITHAEPELAEKQRAAFARLRRSIYTKRTIVSIVVKEK